MNAETKNCQNCKRPFTIEPEDFNFYEKVKVPPPTFCPECRLIRRMVYRNERALYKRKCDLCGQERILFLSQGTKFPVYCRECLAKVKSGEIPPAPRIRLPVMRETVSPSRYSELAEMGIEFQASPPLPKPARERAPRPALPEQSVPEGDRGESRLRQERTPPLPGRTESGEPARAREADRRNAPSHPPAGLPVPGRAEPLENAPEGSLSLSALTPSEKNPKQKPVKPEVDLDKLRESISESLRRASQGDPDQPSK